MRRSGISTVYTACPLDCLDACSITATVSDNTVIELRGNPQNHVTGNFLCAKGRKHLDILNHPQRLRFPLLKRSHGWEQLTWDAALDLVADKMASLRSRYPTTALVHYSYGGNSGILKGLDKRFFRCFGGVTSPVGSLCQGAGSTAQIYDFGQELSHDPLDYLNSRTIIIWGRNPAATAIHLIPFLIKARARGARIILVDPLKTETYRYADEHICLRPGTDGALALAIANVLIDNGLIDQDYIGRNVLGFETFRDYVQDFSLEKGSFITDVPKEQIISLAERYAHKPASIIVGYGIQRYKNGGNTVRAIDALSAITGNIGISGGGVNYGHNIKDSYIDQQVLSGPHPVGSTRSFLRPLLADFIEAADDPPVQIIYTARANPITQTQNSAHLINAFSRVDFKVTVDLFMSDTALYSDLVLPCRHFLEDEDLVFSHNYIQYCNPAVRPEPWLPSELWILNQLARRLGLNDFPQQNEAWWLEQALLPLRVKGKLSMADIKAGPRSLPGAEPVPWQNNKFTTASGKYELYSLDALRAGHSPLPIYEDINCRSSEAYPYQLLTPHSKNSINSQQFYQVEEGKLPVAYIHPDLGRAENVKDGEVAIVATETGILRCMAEFDSTMLHGVVKIYQGWWLQAHGGVNLLTQERVTDLGGNAAYYDCYCTIQSEH